MSDDHFLPRPDFRTAKQVEQAIEVQQVLDTHAAALYLRKRGVDLEVALRVLTRPQRRRRSN
ncbi:MAG TPA: hypothetical protein VGC21_09570 [Telluria sp.]|jgi:hypothetical protein